MNRREAVHYIGLLLGGTMIGANALVTGCRTKDQQGSNSMEFDGDDIAYLDEIAETILPATGTPGAKAAKVGQFMTVMVKDCYEEDDQKVFREGMKKINEAGRKKFGSSFMELKPAQRHELLVALDTEAKEYGVKKREFDNKESEKEKQEKANGKEYAKKEMEPHYFRMMKELTLLGYFTSEIGSTQARRYKETPGRYDPCVPYKKGDKAWA